MSRGGACLSAPCTGLGEDSADQPVEARAVAGDRLDPFRLLTRQGGRDLRETTLDALDKSKVDVRAKLEQHTDRVIKPYEGRINQLLDNFNAGFRIARTKPAYSGGVAS